MSESESPETDIPAGSEKFTREQLDDLVDHLKKRYVVLPRWPVLSTAAIIGLALAISAGATWYSLPARAKRHAIEVAESTARQEAERKANTIASGVARATARTTADLVARGVARDVANTTATDIATSLAGRIAIDVTERTAADRAAEAVRTEVGHQMGEILPKTIDLVNDVSESIVRDKAEETAASKAGEIIDDWLTENGGEEQFNQFQARLENARILLVEVQSIAATMRAVSETFSNDLGTRIVQNEASIAVLESHLDGRAFGERQRRELDVWHEAGSDGFIIIDTGGGGLGRAQIHVLDGPRDKLPEIGVSRIGGNQRPEVAGYASAMMLVRKGQFYVGQHGAKDNGSSSTLDWYPLLSGRSDDE